MMSAGAAMLLLRGIDLLILGIEVAPEIRAAFGELSDVVKKAIEENRDPTDEEFAAIDALTDAVHAQMQSAHEED